MKRIFMLVFTAAVCAALTYSLCALDTSAHSAVIIEAESGRVIYEKNSDTRMPMASTTKIMTALVALESADINEMVSVPLEAVGVEGSSVCLKAGESMSLEELLYAMLLESANDAAAAIAITVGGSIEDFAVMMNEKAMALGLVDTSFANPHGLDAENHYTTAHELALIAAKALENKDFAEMVSTYKHRIPMDNGGYRYLMNHNKMLRLYDGAIGVKTGFTKKSGRCLVSAAERDGMRLICVTLSAPDDWRDHTAMLDYGFENYEKRVLAEDGELEFTLECVGKNTSHIKVKSVGEASYCMSKQGNGVTQTVYLPRFVYAPKKVGECVGRVDFSIDGKVVSSLPLIISEVVERKDF
ncbi:MAG: D-alanyl-D-alanine carboxypeptidase [Ruminococcaceae bacterium]|nr:D-alanyl-D-alanine carboxypeptidase [Oscillospiraceae bacterium]